MSGPEQAGRVARPRLAEKLGAEKLLRLTALTAGPGSGKTTLLSQCFDGRHAVWHTLTPADKSLSVLARSVVRKLRLAVPEISSELVTAVEGARGPDVSVDSGRPMAIAAALAHDLDEAVSRDVILVLDDVHEIGGSGDSANFLAALCRMVPSRLKLVTASRMPLPFPTSRMRLGGEFAEVTATELAFTVNEIEELVRKRVGRDDPELAKEVVALTGGWPVATVLAVEAAGHGANSMKGQLTGQTPLFDYLAEEVLGGEDEVTISRLRDVSLLPWVSADLLDRLGIESSPALEPSSLYMTRAPDVPDAYVVAPLVREYLAERHPIDSELSQKLLTAACEWYAARGDWASALSCARGSGDPRLVIGLLADAGEVMVAAGHTRRVLEAVEEIPVEQLTPAVSLIDAEARQLVGDWEGAIERYRLLAPEDGPVPPAVAWRMGFLKHMQGRVGEALDTYRRGERGGGEARDEASLLGWQASAHWLRGERDEAKDLADEALELARQSDDPRALATAHTVLALVAALDGDRAANDLHYLKALEHAEKGRDVVQTIRIRSNRASAFMEEGEFDAALAELDIALRLADMAGFELWRGMSLSNRGQVYSFRGRLEEAIADLTEARAAFRHIGSLLESYPVVHLGDVYRLRGDTARARAAYEEAIAMAEGQHDLQVLVPAYAGIARLLAPREPELAKELADRATGTDSGIGRSLALVATGWAAHYVGDVERGRSLAEEAAHVARTRRDLPGLGESLELQAAMDPMRAEECLEEAKAIWQQLNVPIALARVELALARRVGGIEGAVRAGSVAETLRRHGAAGLAREASAAEGAMSHGEEESGLVIKTMGGFDVVLSGVPAPRSAWQSRVAREILWMLIAARGRPLTREALIDRLWPDDDLTKASNRLSVALSTIRRILDPDGTGRHDHIVADRDSVRLSRANMAIDVEEFLEDARTGRSLLASGHRERGLALLRSAENRYVGEFLEEEPYADWAISLREEARSEYMTIAAMLAEAATGEGDHDGASRRYLRMLERDPYNEPAHLGLVTSMRFSGRHGTARRLYGNYVIRMAELDVEPEPFPDPLVGSSHS
jgi:ATP/maltotriose-dependent transcriptional regulator MalT/DNA-binding SARP family transcriptional activator